MNILKIKRALAELVWTGALLFAAASVFLRPGAAAGGVLRGLSVCYETVIPALFPFLVLSRLLLDVNGTLYFISDIGLRMLTPRELYAANGFPPDYIIDHDYTGKAYGKTKQVARCGNAVPPPFAEALVRANLPEMCGRQFETMKELYGVI